MCGGATRATRATAKKERKNMSAKLNRIPLVMFFGLTPEENRTVRAAAVREGITPAHYMYRLVLTEAGRFIVPLGSPARESGGFSSGCGVPQSESGPQ